MAGLKDQLEAAGYDTSAINEEDIMAKLDAAGYDVSGFKSTKPNKPTINKVSAIQEASNPQELLKSAAPSNLLKQAGIASVNAPGAVGTAINALPGIGNPAQIVPALQNLVKNPQQIVQAGQRMAQVQGGADLTPQEQLPANLGQAAGTAIEMTVPGLKKTSLEGRTPFSASFNNPKLAVPGALKKAGEAYGPVKNAAINASPKADVKMLQELADKPKQLADYAISRLKDLGDHPIDSMSDAELLAFNEALGKAQSMGGMWADRYKKAKDAIQEIIRVQNPQLLTKMKEFAQASASRVGPNFRFPWMISALNPAEGAIKAGVSAGLSAGGQRMIGAGMGVAANHGSKIASFLDALDKVMKRKKAQREE